MYYVIKPIIFNFYFHSKLKKNMSEFSEDFSTKIKDLNPESYVYEYFEEIKRHIDFRREDLKLKIDNYSNDMITEITHTQESYREIARVNQDIALKLEGSKEGLNKLIVELAILKDSEEKEVKILEVKSMASDIVNDYDELIFGNMNYKFEHTELSIESIFGRFISMNGVILKISLNN